MTARRMPRALSGAIVVAATAVLLLVYARAAAGPPVDFGAYYSAALALRDGRSPYADALAWKAAGYVTGSPGRQPTAETAYVYPPALALALLPLTALPITVAQSIWPAALFGCVLGTAWCLASLVTDRRDAAFWGLVAALAVALVAFKPIRGALTFSKQVDPLILLLLAATIVALVRRRDAAAGLALGLAIAVKPFLVVLMLGLLWKRAYRVTCWAGAVAAVVGLAPLLALGLLTDFLAAASYWAGPAMLASPVGQSAASLLIRTLTIQPYTVPLVEAPGLVAPLQAVIGAGLLVVLARSVSRSREQPTLVLVLEWSLGITALLIFGPLTEEHHLAYLALGLTATLAASLAARPGSAGARRIVVATGALVLFFLLPGTQVVAWGFYRYLDGPIPPPGAFFTFLFLYATLAAGILNLLALQLARQRVPRPG
jgi:hypothetical protein